MTKTTDPLASAVAYLGAVEVAPPSPEPPARGDRAFARYAMQSPSGRWHTFYGATLAKFAEGPLNHFRYQVTIGRAFVLMPSWWTPTDRFAWRVSDCDFPYRNGLLVRRLGEEFEGLVLVKTPSGSNPWMERLRHLQRITADLETGAEVPA